MVSKMIKDSLKSSAFVYGFIAFLDKICNGTVIILIQYLHDDKTDIGNTFYRDILCFICGAASILTIILAISIWMNGLRKLDKSETVTEKESDTKAMQNNNIDVYGPHV